MRSLFITAACLSIATSASASSIEILKAGTGVTKSVETLTCQTCPPLVERKKSTYLVPELASGHEALEMRSVDGKTKLYRTETWFGGSPVVFVSTPSEEMIKAAGKSVFPADTADAAKENPADQAAIVERVADRDRIDTGATTSSVASGPAPADISVAQEPLNAAAFDLRLK